MAIGQLRGQISKQIEGISYEALEVKKRKNYNLKRNLIAKNLRSSKYSQKVVQSKKLYNRQKEKLQCR
jgi:hypothetical protein